MFAPTEDFAWLESGEYPQKEKRDMSPHRERVSITDDEILEMAAADGLGFVTGSDFLRADDSGNAGSSQKREILHFARALLSKQAQKLIPQKLS